jgi:hypothetical protein
VKAGPARTSRAARLAGLAALGTLGFNFPLITLWDRGAVLWCLPLMALALFAGWAILIAAAACVAERGNDEDRDGDGLAGGDDAAARADPPRH